MGRICDFCSFSVEENGDFDEGPDGSVICYTCRDELEEGADKQCEICGDFKYPDQFDDLTTPLVCSECLHASEHLNSP